MLCIVRAGVLCMAARVGLVYCAVSIACSVVVSVNDIVLPCTVLTALCMYAVHVRYWAVLSAVLCCHTASCAVRVLACMAAECVHHGLMECDVLQVRAPT